MKTMRSLSKNHYLKTAIFFLIAVMFTVGVISCEGETETYDLTMAVNPAGTGTATDLTGTAPYSAGTVVIIKAEANEGYLFYRWTAPAGTFINPNLAETTFAMPAQNVIVTANFVSPLIGTWYDLDAVRYNMSGNYTLISDLDFTTAGYDELASPAANGGKGWLPIGLCNSDPFTGSFDGQGYEIRDLFIDRPDDDCVGLFGFVGQTGVVQNVGLVDFDVAGHQGVGGLVAALTDGTVSNSYVIGNATGDYGVGGLVGQNGGNIDECRSTSNVNSDNDGGGLVGWNSGNISNAFSTADVTGQHFLGGLVGATIEGGIVSDSYATGSVTGYDHVGGLMGLNKGTVSNSYSTGSVTCSTTYSGGLVAENWGTVSNSYSTGNVTGDEFIGGLVGVFNTGTVSDSYATNSVTGNDAVGGLVGFNFEGTVSNSFWDTQTSGQSSSAGGTGKTTVQMQDITTFSGAGWDIIAVVNSGTRNPAYIWNIVDGATYPFLSWQP